MLVHHLRKHTDKDPFMMVSGTTGLTGGVDTTYVLEKDKRSDNVAKLYITGWDVEYMELTLQFENCVWDYLSCETAKDVRNRETPEFIFRVVSFMTGREEWRGSATGLLTEMNDTATAVNAVTKLRNQHHEVLAENGIEYRYNRTGKSRLIRLRGDGYDSCDSSIPVGKQPSQPSPTVTCGDSQRGGRGVPCHTPCLQGLVCYTAIVRRGSVGLPVCCRQVELLKAVMGCGVSVVSAVSTSTIAVF